MPVSATDRPLGHPSLTELYRTHANFVWRAVLRFGAEPEAAEDLVHDVFLIARSRLGEFEGRSRPATWLYAITRGVVANHRRRAARAERRLRAVIPPPPAPDPEWLTARKSAAELVADFIAGLSAKQREVFVLADVEGFSGPEIATMLAIPVTAVHARLRAARLKFERLAQGRTEEGTP